MSASKLARVALVATIAAANVVACNRGANQTTDTATAAAATTTDSGVLAPPVGSEKPAMDSAVARANDLRDSLKRAGETPASGLAKGIQPAAHASKNDSSAGAHKLPVKPTNVP